MNLTETMSIIRPIQITPTELTNTNVPIEDHPTYDQGTSYAKQQRVTYQQFVYESLKQTQGKIPDQSPSDWLLVSSTNPYRMFDDSGGSQTENPNAIDVTITPGKLVTAIAFLECVCNQIEIRLIDPNEGEVYKRTISLIDTAVDNLFDYFFESFPRKTDAVVLDLPPYQTASIHVRFEYEGAVAKVGSCILGTLKTLGATEYGVSLGIVDYSHKETNEFGRVTVKKRAYSKSIEFPLILKESRVAEVYRLLAGYRSTPIVWVGHRDREETLIHGFFRDFNIVINNGIYASCTIDVEGISTQ